MIKAYHQVGIDDMEQADRSLLLDRIIKMGELLPAIQRVSRDDMFQECFSKTRGVSLENRFGHAGGVALHVMREMAMEWVERLPEDGSPHTMFNCVDVLAGDLGRLFLSIDEWYTVDTGFVFDAEELVERGASLRQNDLLGNFDFALDRVSKTRFKTKKEARRAIEGALNEVFENRVLTGRAAIAELMDCQARRNDYAGTVGCKLIELVWDGPLPLELSIETWDDGRQLPEYGKPHINPYA